MMQQFAGYALTPSRPEDRESMVEHLRNGPWLVLDTCQRLEVFGDSQPPFEIDERWGSSEAFERLVRIATGLESRVIGELEVLGQVRNAYKAFHTANQSDAARVALDGLFQDVLGLARRARRESGIDANLTSLSGLASREMIRRVPTGAPIAVIGSGTLATSVVRYLGKRGQSPVRVAGRCPDKAMQLAIEAGGFGAGLDDLTQLMEGVHGVITATAAPHPVLYVQHLPKVDHPITVIDLGVPPDCCDETQAQVDYLPLEAIEAMSENNLIDRQKAADKARELIRSHLSR